MPRDATGVERTPIVPGAGDDLPQVVDRREPGHQAPDTTRIGGLLPQAPANNPAPLSPTAIRDGGEAAAVLNDKLSLHPFDWFVTKREVRASIEALRGLNDESMAAVVDQVDPALLTRLTNKLDGSMRTAYAETLERLHAARNAPSTNAEPVDDVIADLRNELDGILRIDVVSDGDARSAIDRLRRLSDADRAKLLDALGPSKTYRMVDNLSDTDKAIYAPTIALVKNAYFGALLRDAEAIGLGPKDVSAQLDQLLEEVANGTAVHPPDMKDYVYFVVPGLVTEHQPGYFDANVAHLESLGLEVHRSKIDTDADVDVNAAQIREEIKALEASSGKKVMLLSHSKGGPDAAEALQDVATEACCHRFVPMQPATATPVASTLMESRLGRPIRQVFTDLLGASTGEALAHLQFSAAKERFRRGRPLQVKTLALASTVGDHFSALRGVSDLIETRYDTKSDGLVTIDEQFVPGENAFRAVLDGVDHTAPCSRPLPGTPESKYSQEVLTEALIILALRL